MTSSLHSSTMARTRALSLLRLAVAASGGGWTSIIGDPGMSAPSPSTGLSLWSFCNSALAPPEFSPDPSPRMADCGFGSGGAGPGGNLITESDEALSLGQPIPGFGNPADANSYAITKEQYLATRCFKPFPANASRPYSHWSIMFKSGNMDLSKGVCPRTNATGGAPALRSPGASSGRVGFNNNPMNQPLVVHGWTASGVPVPYNGTGVMGYYAGTYDVNATWTPAEVAAVQGALHNYTAAWFAHRVAEIAAADSGAPPPPLPAAPALLASKSFLFATWYTNVTSGAMVYLQGQATSAHYPWLMNYIRSNEVAPNGLGAYGGYPWPGGGVLMDPFVSAATPHWRVSFTMLTQPNDVHFYMPCFGGCWKLDGSPCDGNLDEDATRYVCFQLGAPADHGGCTPTDQGGCPAFHYTLNGTAIARSDTKNFPYQCYTGACPPQGCDAYSNPNPQELLFLTPCAEWAPHGFPSETGEGWLGDPKSWDMDIGTLGARLHLSGTDPAPSQAVLARLEAGTLPAYPGWGRSWLDLEVGPEQFASSDGNVIRWETRGWDIVVPA